VITVKGWRGVAPSGRGDRGSPPGLAGERGINGVSPPPAAVCMLRSRAHRYAVNSKEAPTRRGGAATGEGVRRPPLDPLVNPVSLRLAKPGRFTPRAPLSHPLQSSLIAKKIALPSRVRDGSGLGRRRRQRDNSAYGAGVHRHAVLGRGSQAEGSRKKGQVGRDACAITRLDRARSR
jgi:hypothetical protein